MVEYTNISPSAPSVSSELVASLPQIRLLTNGAADWRQVAMALKRSKTLEASSDGKRLRRKTRYEGPGAKAKPKAAGTNPPWWC